MRRRHRPEQNASPCSPGGLADQSRTGTERQEQSHLGPPQCRGGIGENLLSPCLEPIKLSMVRKKEHFFELKVCCFELFEARNLRHGSG